jgi:hypothetical protein
MLANFLGFLRILTPPLCALAFIMCSKSNPLVEQIFQGYFLFVSHHVPYVETNIRFLGPKAIFKKLMFLK